MNKSLALPLRYCRIIGLALLAAGGVFILRSYLHYLNNTAMPLAPNPGNTRLHIKFLIFLWWLLLVLLCLQVSKTRLAAKGYGIKLSVVLRSIVAGILFSISVTTYKTPEVDFSFYFFINTIAYTLLVYGLFSFTHVRRAANAIGTYAVQLLRLPAPYWLALAFSFIFLMAYHLSWVLFRHFPWIDDTIVQIVHAKFILQGHWFGQSEPLRQFFEMKWMINNGRWFSQYPPGHVLMLAVGLALHHVEMVNPFLGACTCIAIWLLAKELYGVHVAKIAVLLTGLCSYIIILSSEYMSNATSLLMCTLFLWGYFRVLNRRGWPYALVAGATLGYCFITRPYTAFGMAMPAALYALYLIVAKPRAYFRPMAIMAATFGCFVLFQLYYNSITTGYPFVFGYQELQGDVHNPFTKTAIGKLTPAHLYMHLLANIQRMGYFNRILFEWPLPAMALMLPVFCLRGNRRDERLLFSTILFMFISVQFVLNMDIGWGPRLVYEINSILLIFCAKSLTMLPPLLRKLSSHRRRLRYYYGAGILILASFYVVAFQYNLRIPTIRELYVLNGREGNPWYYNSIVSKIELPALVFVPGDTYKYVSFTNPPTDDSPVVFAIDLGESDEELVRQYPGRHSYRLIFTNKGLGVTPLTHVQPPHRGRGRIIIRRWIYRAPTGSKQNTPPKPQKTNPENNKITLK